MGTDQEAAVPALLRKRESRGPSRQSRRREEVGKGPAARKKPGRPKAAHPQGDAQPQRTYSRSPSGGLPRPKALDKKGE